MKIEHYRNPPYTAFVASRIKKMATQVEDIHHAATGLVGEVIEFIFAKDEAHANEELGDVEFYLEHFLIVWKGVELSPIIEEIESVPLSVMTPYDGRNFDLLYFAGEILDRSKKCWIYGKPIGEANFAGAIAGFIDALDRWTLSDGPTRYTLQLANQAKLEKRYPDGYSDAAALARADKEKQS